MTSLLKHDWAGSSDVDILYSSHHVDSVDKQYPYAAGYFTFLHYHALYLHHATKNIGVHLKEIS